MKFIIESAHTPARTSDHSIDMMVKFNGFDEEILFTASDLDPEEYGRILYQNAINGEYGEIQ